MNTELVKWLIHQPVMVVAAFALGATLGKAHPELLSSDNLVLILATVAGLGGGAASWQQAGPLKNWIEAPQTKPEGEKS